METLIITRDLAGTTYYLSDANGNLIGRFQTLEAAKEWAKANGYRSRCQ